MLCEKPGAVNLKEGKQVIQAVQEAGVPGSPILQPEDVHKNKQFIARDFLQNVDLPHGNNLRMTGDPFRFSNTSASTIKPAPTLGHNTKQMLKHPLGLSNSKIEILVPENIISH